MFQRKLQLICDYVWETCGKSANTGFLPVKANHLEIIIMLNYRLVLWHSKSNHISRTNSITVALKMTKGYLTASYSQLKCYKFCSKIIIILLTQT